MFMDKKSRPTSQFRREFCIFSYQLSAISYQLSAISYQLSAMGAHRFVGDARYLPQPLAYLRWYRSDSEVCFSQV